MTVDRLFPTPAEVEANTPASRDRAIDVIRIVSLVGGSPATRSWRRAPFVTTS